MGLFDYLPAWIAYFAAGFAAFVFVLRKLSGDWLTALSMALAFGAAPYAIQTGQNAFYSAALLSSALFLLPRHKVAAGVLIGILTFKPQLALAAFPVLFLWREWRALGAAITTVAVLVVAATLIFGWDIWLAFIAPDSGLSDRVDAGKQVQQAYLYQSVFALFAARTGLLVGLAIQAIVGALAILVTWRIKGDDARGAALIAATILVTPFSLFYDMVMLTAAAAFLLRAGPRGYETAIICGAMAFLGIFFLIGQQVGLVPATIFLLLAWIIDERRENAPPAAGNLQAL